VTPFRVALCGNPNVGKSTVFNALTGLKQHTGNWSGKTVDTAVGEVKHDGQTWQLTDLPGAYSLLSGSAEEIVASDYLTFAQPEAVIVVCDAGSLERNLNLAVQIAQYCPKAILCINMLDEAKRSGISIDTEKLEALLGIPVVGICARRKDGLTQLKDRVHQVILSQPSSYEKGLLRYPPQIEETLKDLGEKITQWTDVEKHGNTWRLAALRALAGDPGFAAKLEEKCENRDLVSACIRQAADDLLHKGYTHEKLISILMETSYQKARELCSQVVQTTGHPRRFTLWVDRQLCRKWLAALMGTSLLAFILYLTILGANVPSAWLSEKLGLLGTGLQRWFTAIPLPEWMTDLLINGVYRVTAWVVSVMLPPMAIFFPLFTILEDMGVLPRIAFHLDRCFARCHSCGKQALCMCMGLGCNAVGVTGCRIIQSPRERLIAILTNALIPCNGRFPTLIALITMFFAASQPALGTLMLMLLIVLSVCVTLACSKLLSKTILSGMPSAFALELPPFRWPKWGEVIVRSIFDRTLFVLGRAVSVAAPAGAVVWCLNRITIHSAPLMQLLSSALDPAGKLLGMDGVMILAFVLGFPANEIVLPIALMLYQQSGMLMELEGFESVRSILVQNGWNLWTAASALVFTLFHWPCSTTTLTIYKETHSLRWTLLGILLPTAAGVLLCMLINFFSLFAKML